MEKKEESKLNKEYASLQKKYSLPSLESLELNFAPFDIEHEKFILSGIRKRMSEKIEHFANLLANIFEGDTTLSNICESESLNEKKKTNLFRIYKRLMKYLRKSTILALSYDEKMEAEFINEFFKEWDVIKKELKKQFEEFCESWDNESNIKEEIQNYLG